MYYAGIDTARVEWASQRVRSGTGLGRCLAVSHEDLCSKKRKFLSPKKLEFSELTIIGNFEVTQDHDAFTHPQYTSVLWIWNLPEFVSSDEGPLFIGRAYSFNNSKKMRNEAKWEREAEERWKGIMSTP